MRTTIKKLFWAWEFEEEEQWLNEMAAKGLSLVSVGFCRYEFEDCETGKYEYKLELLENTPNHPESRKYIESLESKGICHVGSYLCWIYLRKEKSEGSFDVIFNNKAKIAHLTRVIWLVLILAALNLFVGFYNLHLFSPEESGIQPASITNILLGVFFALGCLRLDQRRKALKQESDKE